MKNNSVMFSVPLCMFHEMGWMDDNMDCVKEVADADIAQLPGNVSAAVSDEAVHQCAMDMLEQASDCPKAQKMMKMCEAEYSEEEMARIEEVMYATASIECFMQKFHGSCAMAVKVLPCFNS